VRPVRCNFVAEGSGRELLHRAALLQPYTSALINFEAR
jgi:hypothetical protein